MLIGKRGISTSTITTNPIIDNLDERIADIKIDFEIVPNQTYKDISFTTPENETLLSLEYGFSNHELCILVKNPVGPDTYIPYVVKTNSNLDCYNLTHINRLLNDPVFYNTGYSIEVVGLFYYDEILGRGVVEDNIITVNVTGDVSLEPYHM